MTGLRARRAAALTGCLLALGCTRNAVFELELELPPAEGRYVVVEARSGATPDRIGVAPPIPSSGSCARPDPAPPCEERQLDPACSAVVSVVADEAEIEAPLELRIRFCVDPDCADPADEEAPERRVDVERAFYLGRYTQARACIDALPPPDAPIELIERCDVRCREGTAAMYCRLDGTHFCE